MSQDTDARSAILEKITELAKSTRSTEGALRLAEAYAWLQYPNQSHGGGSNSKS